MLFQCFLESYGVETECIRAELPDGRPLDNHEGAYHYIFRHRGRSVELFCSHSGPGGVCETPLEAADVLAAHCLIARDVALSATWQEYARLEGHNPRSGRQALSYIEGKAKVAELRKFLGEHWYAILVLGE